MYHSALTTALQVHLNDVLNLIPANYTTTQITCTSIKFTPSLIILVHQDGSYYEGSARSSNQENVSMKKRSEIHEWRLHCDSYDRSSSSS